MINNFEMQRTMNINQHLYSHKSPEQIIQEVKTIYHNVSEETIKEGIRYANPDLYNTDRIYFLYRTSEYIFNKRRMQNIDVDASRSTSKRVV